MITVEFHYKPTAEINNIGRQPLICHIAASDKSKKMKWLIPIKSDTRGL